MSEDLDNATSDGNYVHDVLVYAKRVGDAGNRRGSSERSIEYYDLCITPPVPVHTGLRIRIHRLVDTRAQHAAYIPPRGRITYNAQASGVIGVVIAVRAMEKGTTEFIVRNDATCHYPYAPDFAYLTVPHIPGITLRLTIWQALTRYLLSAVPQMLPDVKDIELEDGVPITDHTRLWRSSQNSLDTWDH